MARKSADAGHEGRGPLSPLIHGRARLLILSRLLRADRPLSFTELRDELEMSDGALSIHLVKLQEGGLIRVRKEFVGRKPQTRLDLTAAGRERFAEYLAELRAIVPGLAED